MNPKQLINSALDDYKTLSHDLKGLSQLRAELIKVEAAELFSDIKKKLISAVIAVLILFFFACLFLITGISAGGILLSPYLPENLQPFSWQLVAAGVGIIFLITTLICVSILKRKPKAPYFQISKSELKNDQEWLKTLTNKESNS